MRCHSALLSGIVPKFRRGFIGRSTNTAGSDSARRRTRHAPPLHRLPRPAQAGSRPRSAFQVVHVERRKSGSAIVLGKPDESLLIKKVNAGLMPPKEKLVDASVKPIEQSEIDVLVKWI